MDDLFDKLAAQKTVNKVAGLVVLLGLIAGAYYFLFYADVEDKKNSNRSQIASLETEKQSYEKRKKEYQAFRLEVNQLLEEQKELLRVLPKKDDIEQFIEQVNQQVELAGLSKVASVREASRSEEMFVRIPIKMSLVGTYHQINRFFKNIADMKRIVTIVNLHLAADEAKGSETPLLKAEFVAQTFQFVDKPTPVAAAGAPGAPAGPAAAPGGAK